MAEIQEIPLDAEDATEIEEENTEITEENTEIAEEISAPPAPPAAPAAAPEPPPPPAPKPKAARAKGRPKGAANKKPPRPKPQPPPPPEEEEEELPDYVQEAVYQQPQQPAGAHDVATALFQMLATHDRDRRAQRVNKYARWVGAFS